MGTLIIAAARRNITLRGLIQALTETTRISFDVANWVTGFNLPSYLIMALIIGVYLVGGCFIDALAFIMLTVPIFYPVIVSMGYDPMWFGVVIVLVTQIGVITPPVGVNVYVVSGVARTVPLQVIFKGVIPLFIALVVGVLVMIPFPQIALFLPGLMK